MIPLLSAFPSLHDVFHSTPFVVTRNVVVFLAVVFWLGLAYWTFKDARRRLADPWLVGTAALLGLVLPYVGPLVYMLFRPADTLADARARRAELRALEEHLRPGGRCPVCRAVVETDYLVCPICASRLKRACPRCEAPLEQGWQMCPFCATPVESAEDADAALAAEAATLATVGGNGTGRAAARTRS